MPITVAGQQKIFTSLPLKVKLNFMVFFLSYTFSLMQDVFSLVIRNDPTTLLQNNFFPEVFVVSRLSEGVFIRVFMLDFCVCIV